MSNDLSDLYYGLPPRQRIRYHFNLKLRWFVKIKTKFLSAPHAVKVFDTLRRLVCLDGINVLRKPTVKFNNCENLHCICERYHKKKDGGGGGGGGSLLSGLHTVEQRLLFCFCCCFFLLLLLFFFFGVHDSDRAFFTTGIWTS